MITTQKADGALWITLDRPAQRNALNQAMYRDLKVALEQGDDDPECVALVLQAAGKDFCAGNDLADFNHPTPQVLEAIMDFLHILPHLKTPFLALVQGRAVGIGTTMLMYADCVFATEDACFSTPFLQLGLCPEAASSLLFPRFLGKVLTTRMLLLGEKLSAQEAKSVGFVMNLCQDRRDLALQAHQCIEHFKSVPLEALHASKRLLTSSLYAGGVEVMAHEKEMFVSLLKKINIQKQKKEM